MKLFSNYRRFALVAIVCLLVTAGLIAGRAIVTPFTVTEIMGDTLEPGTYTFPDGNMHMRDVVKECVWTGATDSRLNGTSRVVENGNFGKDMTGPMWGTFRSAKRGSGTWDGVWAGYFNLAQVTGEYDGTGHGGGDYEGLQLKVHCVYTGPGPAACTGRILDTGSH